MNIDQGTLAPIQAELSRKDEQIAAMYEEIERLRATVLDQQQTIDRLANECRRLQAEAEK
jgi:hypothetical protein